MLLSEYDGYRPIAGDRVKTWRGEALVDVSWPYMGKGAGEGWFDVVLTCQLPDGFRFHISWRFRPLPE